MGRTGQHHPTGHLPPNTNVRHKTSETTPMRPERKLLRLLTVGLIALLPVTRSIVAAEVDQITPRKPAGDDDLRYWLQNMVWDHDFTTEEIRATTGLDEAQIAAALKRFGITRENRPSRNAGAPLRVMPYPGGRHPRIGFLEGAIDPQRETKVSV